METKDLIVFNGYKKDVTLYSITLLVWHQIQGGRTLVVASEKTLPHCRQLTEGGDTQVKGWNEDTGAIPVYVKGGDPLRTHVLACAELYRTKTNSLSGDEKQAGY